MVMRKSGPAVPEKYRGIEYAVAKQAEGAWTWKVQPAPGPVRTIISGTVKGLNKNPAIEAAHRAIDKMLDSKKR
jgi:hypothetical protein